MYGSTSRRRDRTAIFRQRFEMTRHPPTASGRAKFRLLAPAAIEHERAPGMEAASAGWIDRARHVALQDHRGGHSPGLRYRHSGKQSLGVGMLRRGEDLLPGRHLDDLAEIHDRDTVGHVLDNGQIVADEEQREAELLLQVLEQVDNLCLD